MNDVAAVQLTDRAMANIQPKDDDSAIEELVASGVRVMLRKAVEYLVAGIKSADIRDGVITLLNDKNQPVFTEVKVNGTDVLRDFAIGDAARFVNAFRALKSGRR